MPAVRNIFETFNFYVDKPFGFGYTDLSSEKQREIKMATRIDIKKILADPETRKAMMIPAIIAIQAREGIDTTWEQAQRAYDLIRVGAKK